MGRSRKTSGMPREENPALIDSGVGWCAEPLFLPTLTRPLPALPYEALVVRAHSAGMSSGSEPSPPEAGAGGASPEQQSSVEAVGAKVARVRAACVACFSKKVRCSGEHPCTRCTAKSLECVFQAGGNSRVPLARKMAKAASARRPSATRPKATTKSSHDSSELNAPPTVIQPDASTSAPAVDPALLPRAPLPPIKQPYFRFFGITAISPPLLDSNPFKSISVTVTEQDPAAEARLASAVRTGPLSARAGKTPEATIGRFYELFENYLPYAQKQQTLFAQADGTLSEATFECMSSLVSRCVFLRSSFSY